MKTIKYYLLIIVSIIVILPVSCIVDPDLKETPKDFLSPENAYMDRAGFESALAGIYLTIRNEMYMPDDAVSNFYMLGVDTDITNAMTNNTTFTEQFYWNTLSKDNKFATDWWQRLYGWIFKANVIIGRAENSDVRWVSEEEKNQIVGEALFLRAFSYRFLAALYGGVPLVLTETTSPKFNYTRASQEDVYKQCKTDLAFATTWMKTVDKQPGGRAPRAAAYHLLSEVNIALGDYQAAIDAASKVIGDPNFHLMIERFGVRKNFTFNGYSYQGAPQPWGDVYWDLFQEGNMNWSEGNREAIWNIEMDVNMLGGGKTTEWGGNFGMERWLCPNAWGIPDKNGTPNWLKDTLSGRSANGTQTTEYTAKLIWQYKNDGDRDIRNSKYNIQREFYWTNPAGEFYGQLMLMEHLGDPTIYTRITVPSYKKFTTTVHYGLFTDAASGQNHDQGRIFKDWYIMRMAETYLLRAEAYMLKGDKVNAAKDINVVRDRAHATPVTEADVDLDLIFDERARELYMEEFRMVTLTRTGKLTERLMKYNGGVVQKGYQLPAYKNKFPIPQSEIEANKDAKLEQNPGYN